MRQPRTLGRLASLGAIAWLCSCAREPAPSGAPEEAIRVLYAAFDARSCAAVREATAGAFARRIEEGGCDRFVKENPIVGSKLLEVRGTVRDGRDANLFFVRFVVLGKRPREVTAHVRWSRGAYRVVEL